MSVAFGEGLGAFGAVFESVEFMIRGFTAVEHIYGAVSHVVQDAAHLFKDITKFTEAGSIEDMEIERNITPSLEIAPAHTAHEHVENTIFSSVLHKVDTEAAKMNPFNLSASHSMPAHTEGLRVGYSTSSDETPSVGVETHLPLHQSEF